MKANPVGSRLAVTAATFRISRTQVPEADPLGFYRQIGERESKRLEFEVVGNAAHGLVVRGSYAFTCTEIIRDAAGFPGMNLPNAP